MRHFIGIVVIVLAFLLQGCKGESRLSDSFKLDDDIRMEIKGYTTFRYKPLSCQLAFNKEECEFRVHSDNMSDFYVLRLDEMPENEGQSVNGTVSWTTGDDLHSKKTAFEAVKLEGGKIWLWSASTRIALVVQTLE